MAEGNIGVQINELQTLPQKTTAQMNTISPAPGERPIIYNIDEESPFYWDGLDWVSLIDGLPE